MAITPSSLQILPTLNFSYYIGSLLVCFTHQIQPRKRIPLVIRLFPSDSFYEIEKIEKRHSSLQAILL